MDGRLIKEMKQEKKNDEKAARMPVFVQSWHMNMKASRNTSATCRTYLAIIDQYLRSINPNIKMIKASDINRENVTSFYISNQKKQTKDGIKSTSDSFQYMVWCCMDNFLEYLRKTKQIEDNYIRLITKPKNRDLDRINKDRKLLTVKDFQSILHEVENEEDEFLRRRNKAIIMTFMNTGMRKSALTTIMLDDLNVNKSELVVIDKGDKQHIYELNDDLLEAIELWLQVRPETDDEHLFLNKYSTMMTGTTVDNIVAKYSQKALGRKISPHKLRSGYCSILYKETNDIEFVRRCVGHSNVSTTQRYIVTDGSERRRSAEIMGKLLG